MNQTAQFASYKNLIVYQKSKKLFLDLLTYFSKDKISSTGNFIVNQLLRSTSSIGANIAEGYGRHYTGSQKQFYAIARGSSFESDFWLETLIESGLANKTIFTKYVNINTEITKMLTVLMKKSQTK